MIWLMAGRGTIERRSGAWRIRWVAADGRRRSKTVHGSKRSAQALLRDILDRETAISAGLEDHLAQDLKLEDLAVDYLRAKSLELKPESYRDLAQGLAAVLEGLGCRRVGDLTIPRVVTYRVAMTGSNRTRNKLIGHLRGLVRWAASEGRILRDPLAGLKSLQTRGHEVVSRYAMEAHELRALLDAARQLDEGRRRTHERVPQGPILEVLAWTGLRAGEAASLQWRDVQGSHLVIRAPAKRGESRKVPIIPRLARVLTDVHQRQGRWIDRLPGPQDRILLTAHGRVITGDSWKPVRRFLRRAVAKAGLEVPAGQTLDLHSFRHTYTCILRDKGVDAETARLLLGHQSTAMVERHYGRRERAPFAAAAVLLGEASAEEKGDARRTKGGPTA